MSGFLGNRQMKHIYAKLKAKGLSKNMMILILVCCVVVFIILLIIIILYIVKMVKMFPNLIQDPPVAASIGAVIPSEKIPSLQGLNGYSFVIQFQIKDWRYRYGSYKPLFSFGSGRRACPEIYLDKEINDIIIKVRKSYGDTPEEFKVTNIPIRQFNTLVLVFSSQSIEVYLNGYLETTVVLDSAPHPSPDNAYLAGDGGFYGYISNVCILPFPLNPKDVKFISLLSNTRLRFLMQVA